VAGLDHLVHARDGLRVVAQPGQEPVARDDLLEWAGELRAGPREDHEVIADALQVGDDVRGEDHGQRTVGNRLHQDLHELAARERIE
jgi:hypothetical protein